MTEAHFMQMHVVRTTLHKLAQKTIRKNKMRPPKLGAHLPPKKVFSTTISYAASALIREDKRDNFRETVFFWNTPLVTARCSSGWALLKAASAAPLFPDAIASSTLRRKVLTRERRALFTAVRRAILRTIFLAEDVLAIFRHSIIFAAVRAFRRRRERRCIDPGIRGVNTRCSLIFR